MRNHPLSRPSRPLLLGAVALACVVLTGCAAVAPAPLERSELAKAVKADAGTMRKDVEPLSGPLTMDEAIARALKYNLDRRSRMMEEALALGQLDTTSFDMLPKLVAQAGYASRDAQRYTWSSAYGSELSSTREASGTSTSADRNHSTADLGLTWSLLDIGMGYYGSKQQADRLLIAGERRRKAMHILMQDVRTAYWRAASAQLLKADVDKTIALAEEGMADSRKASTERVRNPLEPLRYQRQLLENLRLLESINQELASSHLELASLINAPMGKPILIATAELKNIGDEITRVPVEKLEELALQNNADLREQHYNARIAREETRRTLVRMFPNVSFNYGAKYDTDRYLLDKSWQEAGVQLSFNVMNLLTGPTQMKLAEAGVNLADQRRMAMQLSVLTQVHIARLQVINARSQYDRADAVYETDSKIAELMRNRQLVQAQSKLDMVSSETASILSLLRRYQALAQVQVAENRMAATLGLEPKIGSTDTLALKELTAQIGQSKAPWQDLADGKAEVKAEVKAEAKVEVKAEAKAETKPEDKAAAPAAKW